MSAEDFWRRWSPWRHGDPGEGNFADVMRVLRLYESFADFTARRLGPAASREYTVLDLGCGAAQFAGPLDRSLRERGGSIARYVGVDFADPSWMPRRVERELASHGLSGRGEYIHHDLSRGIPTLALERIEGARDLLITSCWGVTYLGPEGMRAIVSECASIAARRDDGALLSVSMLTAGQFDREVLTQRFMREIVPRQLMAAVRERSLQPARELALAMKALPRMRAFGTELKESMTLMRVDACLEALRAGGATPDEIDASALWGQITSVSAKLPGRSVTE